MLAFALALLAAILVGTLAEWIVHFCFHNLPLLWPLHRRHHQRPHDVLPWPRDWLLFHLPLISPLFLLALPLGWWAFAGWVAGGTIFAGLLAWSHQQSHAGRWPGGVHADHHKLPRGNYGVTTEFFDRICGTRKKPAARA